MSMIVADDSFEYVSEPNSPNPTGMAVLIFRPSNEGFPDTLRVGDVVQFRHFKVHVHVTGSKLSYSCPLFSFCV